MGQQELFLSGFSLTAPHIYADWTDISADDFQLAPHPSDKKIALVFSGQFEQSIFAVEITSLVDKPVYTKIIQKFCDSLIFGYHGRGTKNILMGLKEKVQKVRIYAISAIWAFCGWGTTCDFNDLLCKCLKIFVQNGQICFGNWSTWVFGWQKHHFGLPLQCTSQKCLHGQWHWTSLTYHCKSSVVCCSSWPNHFTTRSVLILSDHWASGYT